MRLAALASAFTVPSSRASLGDVQRALALEGLTIDYADEAAGIVETPWESTGENTDGTIWAARYLVTIARDGAVAQITVAMDLRTCEYGLGTNAETGRLDASACERLPDGVTPVMYQNRLDRVADTIRRNLSPAG